MKRNNEEVVEEVVGYAAALASIKSWAKSFNDCNGAGRMNVNSSGLEISDDEGSGEYYKAICTNINEAQSSEQETYQIVSGC